MAATTALPAQVQPQPPAPLIADAHVAPSPQAASATDSLPSPAFGSTVERTSSLAGSEQLKPQPEASPQLTLPRPAFGDASPGQSAAVPDAQASTTALPPPGTGSTVRTGMAESQPFTIDDELILELETSNGEVSETITAYGTRAGVYLPLGEIARLLDLALAVSDEGQYASGWVLDEKRTVAINLREGSIRVGDVESKIDPRDAAAMDGELYLRAERFADLMPLTLKVDLRAQTVVVKTLTPFPFEQRASRESARERLGSRSQSSGAPRYPRQETPWRAITFPIGDVELRAMSDTDRGPRAEADVRLAGDVAFMTGQVFASVTSQDGLTNARVELGRRDPDGRLLGPLRATEFQIGDVSTAALPLGLRGIGGRGGMVTNTPLERASVFDKIDLRGELPDGYEAELYRNNTLVASTRTGVNGQYEFLQVPVEFGLNLFRVVLYGPQGQRREQVRQVSVGDGRLAKGELLYTVGAAQKEVNLLGVRGPDFSPGQDYGAWRATAQMQYGLSSAITAALGGAWYESAGASRWLLTTGIRTGIGGIATKLDFGLNDNDGKAVAAAMGGAVAGINWTALHAEYFGHFGDELRAFTIEPLRRASEVELNTSVNIGSEEGSRTIPIAARYRRLVFADGRVQSEASLRASTVMSRLLVSNALDFRQNSSPGTPASTQLLGSFDLASLSGSRTQYRAALGYAVLPQAKLVSAGFAVDRTFGPDTLVKASATHTFDGHQTTVGLSAIHRFRRISLAFDNSVSFPRRSYSTILRLGFSFGRNPLNGALFMARPGMAAGGAVAVRAYEDDNGNRVFDPGEAVLPEVEFDTGTLASQTDRNGLTLIGELGDGTRSYVRMNNETLPDIAMAPPHAGVEIVPRPGRIHITEFPIDRLSDIEGTVRYGSNQREVSGVVVRLVNAEGKAVARVRTRSGGTFLFEQLHPGKYRLELDPDQARRLNLALAPIDELQLDGRDPVVKSDLRVESTAPDGNPE